MFRAKSLFGKNGHAWPDHLINWAAYSNSEGLRGLMPQQHKYFRLPFVTRGSKENIPESSLRQLP